MMTEILLLKRNNPHQSSTMIFQALNSDIGKQPGVISTTSNEHSLIIVGADSNRTKITDFSRLTNNQEKTFNSADIYCLCFDLSLENLSLEYGGDGIPITNEINALRANHPFKTFILIGTKAEASIQGNLENLNILANSTRINDVFLTSSNNTAQINDLFHGLQRLNISSNLIFSQIFEKTNKDNLLYIALTELKNTIKDLPETTQQKVAEQAALMVDELIDKNSVPAAVIETFQYNCDYLLRHSTSTAILKAIATVAITAAVTVIAAAIGFGIGFAAGIWMGPAAFISGIMAGTAAATATVAASGAIGLGVGVLSGYNFFKPSAAVSAVNEVVAQAGLANL